MAKLLLSLSMITVLSLVPVERVSGSLTGDCIDRCGAMFPGSSPVCSASNPGVNCAVAPTADDCSDTCFCCMSPF